MNRFYRRKRLFSVCLLCAFSLSTVHSAFAAEALPTSEITTELPSASDDAPPLTETPTPDKPLTPNETLPSEGETLQEPMLPEEAPPVVDSDRSDDDVLPQTILVADLENMQDLSSLPLITLPLRSTPSDDDMEAVYLLALQHSAVVATIRENGVSRQEFLSVDWDFSTINQTAQGDYAAIGHIVLPEGYAFAENVIQSLSIPIRVETQEAAVITSVENWYAYTGAYAILQRSSLDTLAETLQSSPDRLECYTADGHSYTATVEWDLSGIDVQTVGVYQAIGTISPPENTVFAEGLSLPTISMPISVQAAGQPDINCLLAGRGQLIFPWISPPEYIDTMHVWLSENNGDWKKLEDEYYLDHTALHLFTDCLNQGNQYRLQVDYDGGQTGILTFTYNEDIALEDYHDGDRDGGDIEGNSSSDIIQPAPQPLPNDSHPSDDKPKPDDSRPSDDTEEPNNQDEPEVGDDAEAEPLPEAPNFPLPPQILPPYIAPPTQIDDILFPSVSLPSNDHPSGPIRLTIATPAVAASNSKAIEAFTDTTDCISGTRFLMMLQAGNGKAIFSKGGISISIPEASLPREIQADDWIEVTLQSNDDGGFTFLFALNGTTINDLPNVTVMLPWDNSDTQGTLLDEEGFTFERTHYEKSTGIASFSIYHCGTYRLSTPTSHASAQTQAPTDIYQSFPIIPTAIIISTLLGAIGILMWRKRRL